MKKQFLPILALLGILFTSASCTNNNRHEIGGDIPGGEIENPLPNPEPDKPTPEPEPDPKPEPVEGDNNKPAPEPDPDPKPNPDIGDNNKPTPEPDKPNPDEGDNNKPTPNPDPKPNPDEGDNNKPTPEPETDPKPEPVEEFTFISLNTGYDRVTFDYKIAENVVMQEIALLNTTSNKVEQTLFNGEKVFENAHRDCNYKIKFNYCNTKDSNVKTYYTDIFKLIEPVLDAEFKSATAEGNKISYSLDFKNRKYFYISKIEVNLYDSVSLVASSSLESDVFENLRYSILYTLKANIEYRDTDTSVRKVKSIAVDVKTEVRELDGTEIKISKGNVFDTSFTFGVYSEVDYRHVKTEIYDVSKEEKLYATLTDDVREVNNVLPGGAYKVKYTVDLLDYHIQKSYTSDIIYTMYHGPCIEFEEAFYFSNFLHYKLKVADSPCLTYSNVSVEIHDTGTYICESNEFEGTISNLPNVEYYHLYFKATITHPIFGEHFEQGDINVERPDTLPEESFYIGSPTFNKGSITFSHYEGSLIDVKNYELFENNVLIQTIDSSKYTFNCIPQNNATYYIKANYLSGNSTILLEKKTNSETYYASPEENVIFTFDPNTNQYSIDLLHDHDESDFVEYIQITSNTDSGYFRSENRSGTLTGLHENVYYIVNARCYVNFQGTTVDYDYSCIFLYKTSKDDYKFNYYQLVPGTIEYSVEPLPNTTLKSIELFDITSEYKREIINNGDSFKGQIDIDDTLPYDYVSVNYLDADGVEQSTYFDFADYKNDIIDLDFSANDVTSTSISCKSNLCEYKHIHSVKENIQLFDALTKEKVNEVSSEDVMLTDLESGHPYIIVLNYSYNIDKGAFKSKKAIKITTRSATKDEINISNTKINNNVLSYDLVYGEDIKVNKVSLYNADKLMIQTDYDCGFLALLPGCTQVTLRVDYESLSTHEANTYTSEVINTNIPFICYEVSGGIISSLGIDFYRNPSFEDPRFSSEDFDLYDEHFNHIENLNRLRNHPRISATHLKCNTSYILRISVGYYDSKTGNGLQNIYIPFTTSPSIK